MKFENIEVHYADVRRKDIQKAIAMVDEFPVTIRTTIGSPTDCVEISHLPDDTIQFRPKNGSVEYSTIEKILGTAEKIDFGGETNSLRVQWNPPRGISTKKIILYGDSERMSFSPRGGCVMTHGLEDEMLKVYLECVERRSIKEVNRILEKLPIGFRFSSDILPVSVDVSGQKGIVWLRPLKHREPLSYEGIELFEPKTYKIKFHGDDGSLEIGTRSMDENGAHRYLFSWKSSEEWEK